jgi:copper(I)-binding protein
MRMMHRLSASAPAAGRASKSAAVAAALVCLVAATGAAAAGSVTIEKPWLRLIIKDRPAAGYFTLRNDTDGNIELTGASSSSCGMLMLHQSKVVNGIEQMRQVKGVAVPAHSSLSFAPAGYHLMCMNPQSSLAVGKTVPVTLTFADGTTITGQFPVKGPGG